MHNYWTSHASTVLAIISSYKISVFCKNCFKYDAKTYSQFLSNIILMVANITYTLLTPSTRSETFRLPFLDKSRIFVYPCCILCFSENGFTIFKTDKPLQSSIWTEECSLCVIDLFLFGASYSLISLLGLSSCCL